jgi:hypothetical protein
METYETTSIENRQIKVHVDEQRNKRKEDDFICFVSSLAGEYTQAIC